MAKGRARDAVEILKLNVSLYPKAWGTYDGLGEAYKAVGDKVAAIKNYKRSLELDSTNQNAVEHLRKLGA